MRYHSPPELPRFAVSNAYYYCYSAQSSNHAHNPLTENSSIARLIALIYAWSFIY